MSLPNSWLDQCLHRLFCSPIFPATARISDGARRQSVRCCVCSGSTAIITPQSDFAFTNSARRSQRWVFGHPKRSKRMITRGDVRVREGARVVGEMGAGMWSAGRAATSRCSPGVTVSDLWHRRKSLPVLTLCCVECAGCRSG
jgi:hypothetical protein